jgi:hypothetical protein
MISIAKAPSGLFHSLLELVGHFHPASLLGGQSHPSGPTPEAMTAHLPPHVRVDIGLLDSHTSALEARAPTSQPLLPPVSAMHRRGDWGGAPGTWSWPLRV